MASSAIANVYPNPLIPQNNYSGSNRYNGVKRLLYYVVHDVSNTLNWSSEEASIRLKESQTHNFYATNSGGKFDVYYDPVIVDAAINLNSNGTRPSNWTTLADNIAQSDPTT